MDEVHLSKICHDSSDTVIVFKVPRGVLIMEPHVGLTCLARDRLD